MLTSTELRRMACAKLRDARVLYASKRYDSAVYLCGYAVELALKARICKTLNWPGFPATNKEFDGLGSLKVHDLEILLRLSGRNKLVKDQYLAEWSTVATWTPAMRYNPAGSIDGSRAKKMLDAATLLVRKL